jgi:hypothetical protein
MPKFRNLRPAALGLTMAAVLWSCGEMGQNPTTSLDQSAEPAPAVVDAQPSGGYIVFTPRALAAAKRSKRSNSSTSSKSDLTVFANKRGANLSVKFNEKAGKNEVVVKKAEFKVHKNSVLEDPRALPGDYHLIAMTVTSGTSLDDIRVKFKPSGMKFDPNAELSIEVDGDFEATKLVAYHVSPSEKTVKQIDVDAKKERGGKYTLSVNVSGFSEYSWDDDDDDPCQQPDSGCWGW